MPDSVPVGTVIITRRSVRTSPTPSQVGHGADGIFPRPRHCGQGRVTANPPWPNEMVPRPVALGTSREGGAGRAAVPVAGRTGLGNRQGDRYLPAEHGDAERHVDHRLQALAPLLALPPAEDRREDVAETEATQVAEVNVLGGESTTESPASARSAT